MLDRSPAMSGNPRGYVFVLSTQSGDAATKNSRTGHFDVSRLAGHRSTAKIFASASASSMAIDPGLSPNGCEAAGY